MCLWKISPQRSLFNFLKTVFTLKMALYKKSCTWEGFYFLFENTFSDFYFSQNMSFSRKSFFFSFWKLLFWKMLLQKWLFTFVGKQNNLAVKGSILKIIIITGKNVELESGWIWSKQGHPMVCYGFTESLPCGSMRRCPTGCWGPTVWVDEALPYGLLS